LALCSSKNLQPIGQDIATSRALPFAELGRLRKMVPTMHRLLLAIALLAACLVVAPAAAKHTTEAPVPLDDDKDADPTEAPAPLDDDKDVDPTEAPVPLKHHKHSDTTEAPVPLDDDKDVDTTEAPVPLDDDKDADTTEAPVPLDDDKDVDTSKEPVPFDDDKHADTTEEPSASVSEGIDSENPVVALIDEAPHQKYIAIGAAVVGLCSVIGPSSFVRAFLALVGSALGGLMCASCYLYIKAPPASHLWLDAVIVLFNPLGVHTLMEHKHAYMIWAGATTLGLLRWWCQCECGCYEYVDEMCVDAKSGRPGITAMLKPSCQASDQV